MGQAVSHRKQNLHRTIRSVAETLRQGEGRQVHSEVAQQMQFLSEKDQASVASELLDNSVALSPGGRILLGGEVRPDSSLFQHYGKLLDFSGLESELKKMVKDLQGLSSRVGKLKHKLDTVETAVGLRGRNGGLVPRSEFTDFSKVVREEVLRLATPEEVVAFQDFLVGEVAELATKSQYDKVVYALGQTSSTLLDKVSSVKKDVAELERAVQDEATLPKATTMVHLLSSLRQSLASGLASTEQQQEAERIATWPQISELQTMLATAVQTDANDVRVMGTLRSKLTEMAGRRLLSSELEGLDVVVRKLTNELEANMYGRDLHEPEDELAIHMPPTPLTSPPTLSAMASPTVSPLKTAVAGGLATPLRSHQPSPAGSRRVQVPA